MTCAFSDVLASIRLKSDLSSGPRCNTANTEHRTKTCVNGNPGTVSWHGAFRIYAYRSPWLWSAYGWMRRPRCSKLGRSCLKKPSFTIADMM